MDRPTCMTCPYWCERVVTPGYGECRRHAPTELSPVPQFFNGYGYRIPQNPPDVGECGPAIVTKPDYWCGDHPHFEIQKHKDALAKL